MIEGLVTGSLISALSFALGWYLRAKRLIIVSEQSVKQGLASARQSAHDRAEKANKKYEQEMAQAMNLSIKELREKIGLDIEVPESHTNQQEDDSVNLHRTESPL